jgi:hypothetical protein
VDGYKTSHDLVAGDYTIGSFSEGQVYYHSHVDFEI